MSESDKSGKPELDAHECEHFLMTDVSVYACECDNIQIVDVKDGYTTEYVPKGQPDERSAAQARNGLGYDLLHVTAERDELNTAIAHVWKALGVTDYTGKHISEHVSDLRAQIEAADKLIDWHEGNHKASKP